MQPFSHFVGKATKNYKKEATQSVQSYLKNRVDYFSIVKPEFAYYREGRRKNGKQGVRKVFISLQ
jgi:hypothetical protein